MAFCSGNGLGLNKQQVIPEPMITQFYKRSIWYDATPSKTVNLLYSGSCIHFILFSKSGPMVVNFFIWKFPLLTHLPLVPHICVSEWVQHWFRKWLVAFSAPSHYLNQCWVIVNWNLRNKLQLNFNQNTKLFIQENHLKISSVKWRPFFPGGDEFINCSFIPYISIAVLLKTSELHYTLRHLDRLVEKNQGAVSIRKTVLPGMAIPMLKIRRPNGRLIFNMEIAIRR